MQAADVVSENINIEVDDATTAEDTNIVIQPESSAINDTAEQLSDIPYATRNRCKINDIEWVMPKALEYDLSKKDK